MKNKEEPKYTCADCAYVTFYDWYICTHPEHPIQNHSKKTLPFIYDTYQAETCILFNMRGEDKHE